MSTADHQAIVELGQERRVELQFGRWGGVDLRPSRAFVWFGRDRDARARIISYDRPPRLLRVPRRPRYAHLGALRIACLGSPLVTLPLWFANATRHAFGARSARRSAG